ncbi:unnamed protein product [Paramecium primaurelia]|uniref:RNA-binding S4 domain-containing protein n=1 Tax=Paramecium primaurelia TaxID=5886 RepID=A0A8S1KT99_PARPR|nr:unnamed protein product [Paramecium primaurelia]
MFLTTFIKSHFTKLSVPIFNSHSGSRIDKFLIEDLNRSWNEVQKLIRNGEINVNNKKIKDHQFVLKEGDVVTYWDKLKKQVDTQLRPIPNIKAYEELKKMILYENDQIIILNKLHGYASQGGANPNYNIPEILNLYFKNFYIIHRLDQLTSGLLIIAKNKDIATEISRIIQEKAFITKKYIAIVQGQTKVQKGLIDRPLLFNTNNQKQTCYNEEQLLEGKYLPARTSYEVIQEYQYHDEMYSVLDLQIFEGRKHQIRAHLSQVLKTPILFDQKYGFQFTKTNRDLQTQIFGENQGIMLQAKKIIFQNFPVDINEQFYQNSNGTMIQKNGKLEIEATFSTEFESLFQILQK